MTASMIDIYCVTPVTWNVNEGRSDGYGTISYGADQTLNVKVVSKEIQIRSATTGERKVSNTQIEFNPSYSITLGDKITFDGIKYEVEKVDNADMFGVQDHKHAILMVMGTV